MRKTRVIAALIVALVGMASLYAQDMPQSLSSDISSGIFRNEIDAILSVDQTDPGPNFMTLMNRFVLGGLANLNRLDNVDTAGFGPFNPLWMAYFSPGDLRWSFMKGIGATTFTGLESAATESTQNKGADPTYTWADGVARYDSRTILFREINYIVQFLVALEAFSTGLFLQYFFDDNGVYDLTGENYIFTDTTYYDAAGAGEAPDPREGYTYTFDTLLRDRITRIFAVIPFYMMTGGMHHYAEVTAAVEIENNSSADHESFAANASYTTAIGATGYAAEDAVDDKLITTSILFDYTLGMDPILGQNENNMFKVGLSGGVILNGAKLGGRLVNRQWAYDGAGTETDDFVDDDVTVVETGAGIYLDPTISASHSFRYEPAPQVSFAMEPRASLTVDTGALYPRVKSVVTTVRTDNDADGAISSAADTVTIDRITYSDSGWNGAAVVPQEREFVIGTSMSLPVALNVAPDGWPFSFTLSANPVATYTRTKTTTAATTVTTYTQEVQDGTGAVTTPATATIDSSAAETSSVVNAWGVSSSHRLGLHFAFPGNVKADVLLNGFNFLEFDGLQVQVVVPLP